jgi:hypothetical protein
MNKRIKRKLATKENKNMMDSTLKYLKTLGLTPFNVEYPKGYFVFENKYSHEMMHFQLKENPEFLFGVWYKEVILYESPNSETVIDVVKLPVIFGERLFILDKFKPSRAEWSPLYNQYIDKGQRFELTDYYATLRSLKDFVKTPWNYIPYETEEEYKKLLEDKQLEEKCTEEVLQVLYTKVEEKLKELKIPRGILVQDSYWSHKNLYVFFENGTDKELIEDKLSLLYDFLNFDLDKLVVEVAESLNCLDFISIYSKEFAWHSNYYWLASKEELENFESMSFMELNKHFNDLNLKGSNFVRLIGD